MTPSDAHNDPQVSEEKPSSESTSSRNPVGRLAGESRALFDDLREWVDLRVQLVQVDIEERIEKAANEAIAVIAVLVLALFAVVFLLHGVAVWIGSALGGVQWGYLIVGGFLAVITLIIHSVKPDFVGSRKRKEAGSPALKASEPPHSLPEQSESTSTKADAPNTPKTPHTPEEQKESGNG